jgi:signal transduction protein with GAF and PtsI domain
VIALTETSIVTMVVASIAAVSGVASTILTAQNKRNQDTGNGHTIGRGVARLEDRMGEHETRLDRIEVKLAEDMGEIKQRLTSAVFEHEHHLSQYRHEKRAD